MYSMHFPIGERRLLSFKFKENIQELGSDTFGTYIREPIKDGNPVQAVLGIPAAAARAVLEAPDAVFEGALDRRLDLKTDNRIIRDVSEIGKSSAAAVGNLLTLKPVQALKSVGGVGLAVLRTPQSMLMEVVDQGGGFDVYRQQSAVRKNIEHTLSTAA